MPPSPAPYVGDAAYCYANTAAMLLATVGEEVAPGLFESMTAVGAGARLWRDDGLIYFSLLPPDIGLSRAFRALGFAVEEDSLESDAPFPLDKLEADLAAGPLLIGPLDMKHLTYLPGHESLGGVDHYVLLTAFDAPGRVRLHDPKGYPNVTLSVEDLEAAWRATKVGYARGAFRAWSSPRRVEGITRDELLQRCLAAYRAAYAWEDESATEQVRLGQEAFEAAAASLTDGDNDRLAQMLTVFGFPLGARRAHDLALLLGEDASELAAIKRQQAIAFVDGFRHLVDGDRRGAAEAILRVAEKDVRFRERLAA